MESVGQATTKQLDLSNVSTINASAPARKVSDKYSLASTRSILDIFGAQGWVPSQYQERKVRNLELKGTQTHSVVLANESLNRSLAVGSTLPRIVVKNSHDGTTSLQMLSGLFERICANGLIVGTSASDIRIRHMSLSEESIVAGVHQCIRSIESALMLSERMKAIKLENDQRVRLAEEAIEMIWDGEKYSIMPNSLLWNHRRDQREPTLWNTFNTIQEHVIRGGVTQRREDGSRIRSREVKSIDRNIELNRKLWDLAESKVQLWA